MVFKHVSHSQRGREHAETELLSASDLLRRPVKAASEATEVTEVTGPTWGFAQILDRIDVGILVLDLQQRQIDYQNPNLVQVLQDERLCGDFQDLYDLLLKNLEESQGFENAGHLAQLVTLSGHQFGCSVYKIASRYRCILIRDITEKIRLESIAQAVNAMDNIGFIFSGIRHEVGNPLNSLKMALSVLKQNLGNFSAETVSEYIDRGLADIGRMEYLLKSLRTFSVYDHVEVKDQPLMEFMAMFLALVERDFQSYGIRIITDTPLDIASVRIDQRALHQALLNIFNNAVEALQDCDAPEIRVSAELRGQLVWLTIADNGCGVPSEQQKHLFQPFNTSKPNGNGLGLVITRKLLAMMDSAIDIESQPKQGTRVTISLPVSPATTLADVGATDPESFEQDKM
jgi:signal transduction histidine kinase